MYFTRGRRQKIALTIFAGMMVGILGGGISGSGVTRYASAAESISDVSGETDNLEESTAEEIPVTEVSGDTVADAGPNPDEPGEETNPTQNPADRLQITEFQMTENTATSITLAWQSSVALEGVYSIYQYNADEDRYDFVGDSKEMYYTCTGLEPAKRYYFVVRAIDEKNGIQGVFSERLETFTKPKKVKGAVVDKNKAASIQISWNAVAGADGYEIYRAEPNEAFVQVGSSIENTFTDIGLSSGQTYRYKIRAYSFEKGNTGAFCTVLKTTTLPAKPIVKVKGGEKKARVTWGAVTGATGYYLYWYDGEAYQYLATFVGKSSTSYVHINLRNSEYSKYKVEAYRVLDEVEYKSAVSDAKKALVQKQKATTTSPKLYKTKKGFKSSSAYQSCKDFKKKVVYAKNYVIPGLSGTNVDGFYSSKMCPQGLTFAKSYLLLSAYDRNQEENSVIYVMDKTSKKLILTVALPNKTHAGGITYDGYNIWVTQSNKVHAIPFSEIEGAIASGEKTYSVEYKTTCELTHAASTLTYYKDMLWVASYDELAAGYLGAYIIEDKKGTPVLTKYALTRIATRVQGIEFTDSNKLILSRSCQTDSTKRGFIHVLDVYKPNLSKLSSGKITLGAVKKTIEMPTMNEEIAIRGKYLYVSFESAAFTSAVKPMDRVCAFKTTSITG